MIVVVVFGENEFFFLQNEKWDTWNFHLQQRLGDLLCGEVWWGWGKLRVQKKTVLSMLHNSAFWCMEDKNIFILNSSSQRIFIPHFMHPPTFQHEHFHQLFYRWCCLCYTWHFLFYIVVVPYASKDEGWENISPFYIWG